MTYALLSDVHGNLPALLAVIDDAKAQGADRFLLLGDYYGDVPWLPWPNETAAAISGLQNAVTVRGNKEDVLVKMRGETNPWWDCGQFEPLRWNYETLTAENLDFLMSLPGSAEVETPLGKIYMAHRSPVFFRKPRLEAFHSDMYPRRADGAPYTHEEYLMHAREALLNRADAMEYIEQLPGGVYTFGHNHMQWHMSLGDKLFVNPGSCGAPTDCDARAAYTLLTETVDGWTVDERRVDYGAEAVVAAFKASDLYARSEMWAEITVSTLRTAGERLAGLFKCVDAAAKRRGWEGIPVSDEIWREAGGEYLRSNKT